MTTRWLFGDQLGPHFTDDHDGALLIVESQAVFRRRRFHRQKAHLVLSAMRHRAAELGDRVTYLRADTYREALAQVDGPLQVMQPTSFAALRFVEQLSRERPVELLPARGFLTARDEFEQWAARRGSKRLLMEDYYRDARRRLGVLMDGDEPAGGRWNYDTENREPPPKDSSLGTPEPWWPEEDDVDAAVRGDLDGWERDGIGFVGRDGPRRFAATTEEAGTVLDHFLEHRLEAFGPYEDAMLSADRWMAHSVLSAPQNLGLVDPADLVSRAEQRWRSGAAPLASVEGFIRQVMGWREYMWHLYWHFGHDYRHANALAATADLPGWFDDLDGDATEAHCLSDVLTNLRDDGWVHHIPRLMVLGSYALQRGWDPLQVMDWFHRSFVDGYDWVMVANIIGMSQHADGGALATKPYTSAGAYINRMSDYCSGCRFDPKVRLGEDACPFTAGYWSFLARNRERLAGNPRMRRPLMGLDRLADLDEVMEQEARRGSAPPRRG